MPATPAQTTRTFPKRVVPPIELPASSAELAREAAAQLGWEGTVLEMELLGRRVCVVARLRTAEHAERLAMGVDPVTDRASVSTWTWPELAMDAPPEAADVVGVLAVARHWRTGLASVVPFAKYYPEAALVLPGSAVMSTDYVDNCLPRARAYGLAVVSADENAATDLDVSGRAERMMLGADALTRWINEMVYEQLLALQAPAEVRACS